jgi:hypothetical protein
LHNDLDNKPYVRNLKVVDPEDEDEIMAYAKWEVYPKGRPDLDKLRQPMPKSDKQVDDFGRLREAAHEYFCTRNGEMGKHPHLRKSTPAVSVAKFLHVGAEYYSQRDRVLLMINSSCTSRYSQRA